jgi:hypothetical protein
MSMLNVSESREVLSVTLPVRWQRVNPDRLLDAAASSVSAQAIAGPFDLAQAQGAQRMLAWARNLCHDGHVVLVAIRMRPDAQAIDQLSLALPSMEPTANSDSINNATSSTHQRPEITEDVDINGLPAVSHRSVPAESPAESVAHGSQVQLVFVVPGSERGAVLTILSSASGVEDLLERDAEEIVRSVSLTSADEA